MSDAWKDYERAVADYAAARGLPWERRLMAGRRDDLLDLDGTLPMGWLVGCKHMARATGQERTGRFAEAMAQCHRAMDVLAKRPGAEDGVIPVQVMQRKSEPGRRRTIGASYVVTELDWFLDLVELRAKLEAGQ